MPKEGRTKDERHSEAASTVKPPSRATGTPHKAITDGEAPTTSARVETPIHSATPIADTRRNVTNLFKEAVLPGALVGILSFLVLNTFHSFSAREGVRWTNTQSVAEGSRVKHVLKLYTMGKEVESVDLVFQTEREKAQILKSTLYSYEKGFFCHLIDLCAGKSSPVPLATSDIRAGWKDVYQVSKLEPSRVYELTVELNVAPEKVGGEGYYDFYVEMNKEPWGRLDKFSLLTALDFATLYIIPLSWLCFAGTLALATIIWHYRRSPSNSERLGAPSHDRDEKRDTGPDPVPADAAPRRDAVAQRPVVAAGAEERGRTVAGQKAGARAGRKREVRSPAGRRQRECDK